MRCFALLAALVWVSVAANAQESLAGAIPDDHFFVFHREAGSGGAAGSFGSEYFSRVRAAVSESGLGDELVRLVAQLYEKPTDQAAAREELAHVGKLLRAIDWDRLLGGEFAFGLEFRIEGDPRGVLAAEPHIEWLLLARVSPEARQGLLDSLRQLLVAVSAIAAGDLDAEGGRGAEVITGERAGAPATVVVDTTSGRSLVCLGAQGGVIGLSSSARELRRAFLLLEGRGGGVGVEGDAAHTAALSLNGGVPAGRVIFRPGKVLGVIESTAKAIESARGNDLAEVEEVSKSLRGLADVLDVLQLGVAAGAWDSQGWRADYTAQLTAGERGKTLRAALFDRKPLADVDRIVPARADAYWISSGPSPSGLGDVMTEFFWKVIPEGSLLLDEFHKWQERSGFDVKRDLLSLIDGQFAFVSLPARPAEEGVKDSRALPGDRVLLLRLADRQRFTAQLEQWVKNASGATPATFTFRPVAIPGVRGEFLVLASSKEGNPLVIFGVTEDTLVAGGTPDGIRETVLARAGKGPTRAVSKDVSRLGCPEGSELHVVAFVDIAKIAAWTTATLSFAGLFGGILPPVQGGEAVDRELLRIAPKLLPVFRAVVGPFRDAAAVSWRENGAPRGRLRIQLKDAPPEEAPAKKRREF